MSFQNSIIDTLSESNDKIAAMNHNIDEFKQNVGKVVIFLQTFEYDYVKDTPSYEASRLHTASSNGLYMGERVTNVKWVVYGGAGH